MSLVASLLIWCALALLLRRVDERPGFWSGYRTFLTLFWMTAPLAWLYAVPWERFLDPYGATVANLWSLAVVALWRVVLTVRVAQVLTGVSAVRAFFVVAAVADIVAVVVTLLSPKPILAVMGGIQHTPQDALLLDVTVGIAFSGIFAAAVFIVGAFFAVFGGDFPKPSFPPRTTRSSTAMWALAAASVLAWGLALPATQGEQRRAFEVDEALARGDVRGAFALMNDVPRSDFPPHFDPRPRNWEGQTEPSILDVLDVLVETPPAPWVREVYLEKLRLGLHDWWWRDRHFPRLAALLKALPEGEEIVAGAPENKQLSLRAAFDEAPEGWLLEWSDEFDLWQVDPTSWTAEVMPDPFNEELQYYTDRVDDAPGKNLWLEDGSLVIEARAEAYEHRHYTSGRLISQGKREFYLGRFEARIRQPAGVGLWPAFWFLGGNIGEVGWPACGEIDVMEGKGRLPGWTSGALHRGPDPEHNLVTAAEYTLESGSFHDDWHVFAVEWKPEEIRWYVDGVLFQTVAKPADVDPAYWPFDRGQPFFILFNLAIGGWFDTPHLPPEDMAPKRLYVDWVRVYRSARAKVADQPAVLHD
jgi:beta-glucanase (GH16 family)